MALLSGQHKFISEAIMVDPALDLALVPPGDFSCGDLNWDEGYMGPFRVLSAPEYLSAWRRETAAPVPTGIEELDRRLGGGIPVGQVTMFLAYTGVGKSELCRQIRLNRSRDGVVLCFDYELTDSMLAVRDLAQTTGIASSRIWHKDQLNDLQFEALCSAEAELGERQFYLFKPSRSFTLEDISHAIEYYAEPGDLVIVDSCQRFSSQVPAEQIRLQVQGFMHWAAAAAEMHDVAMIVTGEQKRGKEGGKPSEGLTSGAESRSIEFQSHTVISMVKIDDGGTDEDYWKDVEVCIEKTRDGREGVLDSVLRFRGPCWGMEIVGPEGSVADAILQVLAGEDRPISADAIRRRLKKRGSLVKKCLASLKSEDLVSVVTGARGGYVLSKRLATERQ